MNGARLRENAEIALLVFLALGFVFVLVYVGVKVSTAPDCAQYARERALPCVEGTAQRVYGQEFGQHCECTDSRSGFVQMFRP